MAEKTHKALVMKKIDGKPGQVYYPLHTISIPTPEPSQSTILLTPTHISLNHRDLFLRQALYPSPSFTTPILCDACCTDPSDPQKRYILNPAHGWHSSPLAPESKSFAALGGTSSNPLGVAQEILSVSRDEVAEVPPHLSSAEAAALPLAGLTAWRALVTKSSAATAGSAILVTGIGGGVALMTLQFAAAIGVAVYVTSSSPTKLARAQELGATAGVSYKQPDWDKALRSLLPPSKPYLDAIIDGSGADIASRAAKLLKPGGVLVSYGMTAGPAISVPMAAVLKNIEVRGSTMGSREEFRAMVGFVGERGVRPVVSRTVRGVLGDVEGWDGLFGEMRDGGQMGKLVFEVLRDGEGEGGGVGGEGEGEGDGRGGSRL